MAVLRASEVTHKNVKELAGLTGLPMQTVLERAVDAYRRTVFLEQFNRDYAALRNDPAAWEEEQAERMLWEQTLGDGLVRENNG